MNGQHIGQIIKSDINRGIMMYWMHIDGLGGKILDSYQEYTERREPLPGGVSTVPNVRPTIRYEELVRDVPIQLTLTKPDEILYGLKGFSSERIVPAEDWANRLMRMALGVETSLPWGVGLMMLERLEKKLTERESW